MRDLVEARDHGIRFSKVGPSDKTAYAGTEAADKPLLIARNMLTPHATDLSGFISLAPGAYTFVVKAKTDADQGVGIIEAHEVD